MPTIRCRLFIGRKWALYLWYLMPGRPWWLMRLAMRIECERL